MFQNRPLLIGIGVAILLLVLGPIIWGMMQPKEQRTGTTGRQEIVIWNLFDEEDAFARIIQAYRQQDPQTIITYRRFTNIEQYNRLLASELAEGKGPDIFALHYSQMHTERGKIVPMPIDHQGLTVDVFKAAFVPAAFQAVVFPETVKEGNQDVTRERIYGMPLYVDNLALFFNEQHLENFAQSAFPKTFWTGVVEQAQQITQQRQGALTRSGIALGAPDSVRRTADTFALLLLQFGGTFYTADGTKAAVTERVSVDGRSFVPAQETFSFLSSFAEPTSRNYTWSDHLIYDTPEKEIAAFVRGDTAMIIGYSYYLADIYSAIRQFSSTTKTITNGDVGISVIPQISDPSDGRAPSITLAETYPLVVSRNSKASDRAWSFLVFASQDAQMRQYFERTKKPVSKRTLIDDLAKANPTYEVFLRQALTARLPQMYDKTSYEVVILQLFRDILAKRATPEQAVTKLNTYLECIQGVATRKPDYLDRVCTE